MTPAYVAAPAKRKWDDLAVLDALPFPHAKQPRLTGGFSHTHTDAPNHQVAAAAGSPTAFSPPAPTSTASAVTTPAVHNPSSPTLSAVLPRPPALPSKPTAVIDEQLLSPPGPEGSSPDASAARARAEAWIQLADNSQAGPAPAAPGDERGFDAAGGSSATQRLVDWSCDDLIAFADIARATPPRQPQPCISLVPAVMRQDRVGRSKPRLHPSTAHRLIPPPLQRISPQSAAVAEAQVGAPGSALDFASQRGHLSDLLASTQYLIPPSVHGDAPDPNVAHEVTASQLHHTALDVTSLAAARLVSFSPSGHTLVAYFPPCPALARGADVPLGRLCIWSRGQSGAQNDWVLVQQLVSNTACLATSSSSHDATFGGLFADPQAAAADANRAAARMAVEALVKPSEGVDQLSDEPVELCWLGLGRRPIFDLSSSAPTARTPTRGPQFPFRGRRRGDEEAFVLVGSRGRVYQFHRLTRWAGKDARPRLFSILEADLLGTCLAPAHASDTFDSAFLSKPRSFVNANLAPNAPREVVRSSIGLMKESNSFLVALQTRTVPPPNTSPSPLAFDVGQGLHPGLNSTSGPERDKSPSLLDALDPWEEAIWLSEVKVSWSLDGVSGDLLRTCPLTPVWPLSSAIAADSQVSAPPRNDSLQSSSSPLVPTVHTQKNVVGTSSALVGIQDMQLVDLPCSGPKDMAPPLDNSPDLALCVALRTSPTVTSSAPDVSPSEKQKPPSILESTPASNAPGTRLIVWEFRVEAPRDDLSPAFQNLGNTSPLMKEIPDSKALLQPPFSYANGPDGEETDWVASVLTDKELDMTLVHFVPPPTGWAAIRANLFVATRPPFKGKDESSGKASFMCFWSPQQDVVDGDASTATRQSLLHGQLDCVPAWSSDFSSFAQLNADGKLVLQRHELGVNNPGAKRLRDLHEIGAGLKPLSQQGKLHHDASQLRDLITAARGHRGARTLLELASIVRFFDQSQALARANVDLLKPAGAFGPTSERYYVVDHVWTLLHFSEWVREQLCFLFRLALLHVEVDEDAHAAPGEVEWHEKGAALWVRSLLSPAGCDLWLRGVQHVLAFNQWLRRGDADAAPQAQDFLDVLPTTLRSRAAGYVGPQGQKVSVQRVASEQAPTVAPAAKVPWLEPAVLKSLLDQAKVVSHVLQQQARHAAIDLAAVARALEAQKAAVGNTGGGSGGPIWDPRPSGTGPCKVSLAQLFVSLADARNGCIRDGLALMLAPKGTKETDWEEDWMQPLDASQAHGPLHAGGVGDLAVPPPPRDILTKERLPALPSGPLAPGPSSQQALPPGTPGGGLDALAPITPAAVGGTPLPSGPAASAPSSRTGYALGVCTACGGLTRPSGHGEFARACLCGGRWFGL